MSYYFHSKSVFDYSALMNRHAAVPITGEPPRQGLLSDHQIDSALRGVPLPEGLMTRLGTLVHAMHDETADQVDWLGC